jgi:peptidyl-prolyl cis-trans isomerase D
VVVRVAEHRPAETQPLEVVREQVRERLVTREASRLATEEAARLAEALREGGDPGTLADDSPAMIREAGWVRRDGTDLPRPLVPPLFKMPPPPEDGVTTEVVPLPAGDSAVLALQGVRNGELAELSEQEITGVRRDLQQLRARGHLQALVDSLRQDADVSIREERL